MVVSTRESFYINQIRMHVCVVVVVGGACRRGRGRDGPRIVFTLAAAAKAEEGGDI